MPASFLRMEPADKTAQSIPVRFALLAGVAIAVLICGGLLVYGSGRGLDLTDEIFYLIWARDPNAYALMYQPFGYLLHPLFELCRGDLRVYRLAGFAVAGAAGAILGYSVSVPGYRLPSSVYGVAAALTIFFPWIVTPSYNSAANVGAMLTIAGILSVRVGSSWQGVGGVIVGAAGLCISAFSKPPLCAILVCVILVVALLTENARTRLSLFALVLLGVALVTLFVAPSEIVPLIRRIVATQHVLSLPNTPLRLPGKVVHDWVIVPPILSLAAIAAVLGLAVRRPGWSKWSGYATVALSLYYVASIVPDATDGSIPDFLGLALVIAAAGYAIILRERGIGSLFPVFLLLGAPIAVALGTFNNQWAQLTYSMAFPLLGLFVLASADPAKWRSGIAFGLAIVVPIAVTLLGAFYPYSLQDSVFEQQIPVRHPITRDRILVDEDTAAFMDSAQGLAKGVLLIDLSGTGPGVAAVLGAQSPVLPWLNPATATWPDVVWSRLTLQQREQAWFVGPIRPIFARSAPAAWLLAHEPQYCRTVLEPMTFWDEARTLEVWHSCGSGEKPGQ